MKYIFLALAFPAIALSCNGGSPSGDAWGDDADLQDPQAEDGAPDFLEEDTPDGDDMEMEEVPSARCGSLAPGTRSGAGPAGLLSDPAFASRPADLGIDRASVAMTTVNVDGRDFLVVQFDVTTFENRFGRDWSSAVTVIAPIPDDLAAATVAAAVAQNGTSSPISPGQEDPTWGTEHPPWFAGTDTALNFSRSYGSIAYSFMVPVVIGMPVPDAVELDAATVSAIREDAAANADPCDDDLCSGELTDENVISDCLRRAAFSLEDLIHDPYLNYAVAMMRILDAAQAVLNGVYEARGSDGRVQWDEVLSMGSSKRGNMQRLLAALDDRIAGIEVAAADIANFPVFFDTQLEMWEGAYSFNAPTAAAELDGPFGRLYLDAFDQFRWDPAVLARVVYVLAVGTNDPAYPIMSSLLYEQSMPAQRRFILVPNYGHGMGAVDHLAGLRALVDMQLGGASWPGVEARWDWVENRVTAVVEDATPDSVELWCTTSQGLNRAVVDTLPDCSSAPMNPEDGTDLRHALWTSYAMSEVEAGTYEAPVPPSDLAYPACMVRIVTGADKVSTSLPLLSEPLCRAAGLVEE